MVRCWAVHLSDEVEQINSRDHSCDYRPSGLLALLETFLLRNHQGVVVSVPYKESSISDRNSKVKVQIKSFNAIKTCYREVKQNLFTSQQMFRKIR